MTDLAKLLELHNTLVTESLREVELTPERALWAAEATTKLLDSIPGLIAELTRPRVTQKVACTLCGNYRLMCSFGEPTACSGVNCPNPLHDVEREQSWLNIVAAQNAEAHAAGRAEVLAEQASELAELSNLKTTAEVRKKLRDWAAKWGGDSPGAPSWATSAADDLDTLLVEVTRLRAASREATIRTLFMLQIYGAYKVSSRGPIGCIHDILRALAPEIQKRLANGEDPSALHHELEPDA